MSLRPTPVKTPVIIPLVIPSPSDDNPSRPEPRLTTTIDIPPVGVALHLEIAWVPPVHGPRLRPGPDERLVEGPGGWIGLGTLTRQPATSPAS